MGHMASVESVTYFTTIKGTMATGLGNHVMMEGPQETAVRNRKAVFPFLLPSQSQAVINDSTRRFWRRECCIPSSWTEFTLFSILKRRPNRR